MKDGLYPFFFFLGGGGGGGGEVQASQIQDSLVAVLLFLTCLIKKFNFYICFRGGSLGTSECSMLFGWIRLCIVIFINSRFFYLSRYF